MGGISTGIGLISGIDTASLIEQLLAVESRPRTLVQRRALQLQAQQSAYLDLNSRLNAFKNAASAFRVNKVLDSMRAASSDTDVLTASATTGAVAGSYTFIVDQLVTNQQLLSDGFADLNSTALGATSFTVEDARGRLDRDMALADLNAGEGVERGKVVITQGSNSEVIDLSKAVTVNDVLEAINSATTVSVSASVKDGKFVIESTNATAISVANATGSTTATSLGLTGINGTTTTEGSSVYRLGDATALASLNDGNGVFINTSTVGLTRYDFTIKVGTGTAVQINVGSIYEDDGEGGLEETSGPARDVEQLLERINDTLADAGYTEVTASVSNDGTRFVLTDTLGRAIEVRENGTGTTAQDLGFATSGSATGTMTGVKVLAGLNSTLAKNILGGDGSLGDGTLSVTARDGTVFNFSVDTDASIDEIVRDFNASTGGKVVLALSSAGTGLVATDTTGSTTSNLKILGNTSGEGTSTAEALGIQTASSGVASDTVKGSNVQHKYVATSTLLASLNGGKGVGTGTIQLTDSVGNTASVDIDTDSATLGDIIEEINSRGLRLKARINDNGDGLEIYEEIPGGGTAGSVKMKIEDTTGTVASSLRIAGEAEGTGTENVIDGSYERAIEFEASDTLEDIAAAINEAGAGISAAVVNTGVGSKPFKLSLASTASGTSGRFTIDTGNLDLEFTTLDAGRDARVFFGSTDPASAVLLTSSSNSLDGVLQGVNIDLLGTSDDPVSLTVTRNTGAIEEKINEFVSSFNELVARIDFQTRFNSETGERGPLLGDGTTIALRDAVYRTLQVETENGSGSVRSLLDVGILVGEGGQLTFDTDAFRAALDQDPEGVEEVFALYDLKPKGPKDLGNGVSVVDPDAGDEFNAIGVMGQIEQFAKEYIDSVSGVLTQRGKSLQTQVDLQRERIEAFDIRLEARRAYLLRQFTAMETALAQLQSQQAALTTLSRL